MSRIVELFGCSSAERAIDWPLIIQEQQCPFLRKKCYKVRKSDPSTAIGSCTVLHGKELEPVIICPSRLIDQRQIFVDCFHLLTSHEPGNELHLIPEVSIPGGSVDYFLVSARDGKIRDFVGIELQTMDTTGTVWPERQRLLREFGIPREDEHEMLTKTYGINWKMTAKTILVQIHHKVKTFEHIHKKLVLVLQDKLLAYMNREFNFSHLAHPGLRSDSMHFHAYRLEARTDNSYRLFMELRWSTDSDGIARCLDLQADARVELEQVSRILQNKLSAGTIFTPV